jgi:hypothetical protein
MITYLTLKKNAEDFKSLFQQLRIPWVNDVLVKLATSTGKQSFLVFKNHKYVNVLTENIAFFFIKYDSAMIMCFDKAGILCKLFTRTNPKIFCP